MLGKLVSTMCVQCYPGWTRKLDVVQFCRVHEFVAARMGVGWVGPFLEPTHYLQGYRQQDIPYNAHLCALKFHLDYDALKACVFSLLGQELMYAAMHEAHRRDVRASPTVFVNGRKVSSDEYLSAVCRAYTGTPPPGCQRAVLEEGIA
eukprot:TRINITY_DN3860_c0_g1_i2.p4 TRINITY_DN3860_c0_g1~~TRINITY_DN3860_c0_g1_i2.p4  ORF type:complete len:148 (-),score=20.20 TRINITY_DN3860_c0_g1_i2:21-464(-)